MLNSGIAQTVTLQSLNIAKVLNQSVPSPVLTVAS